MKIGFIGAGKVGFSLGKYFKEQNLEITGYFSKNPQSALEAACFTHTKNYDTMEKIVEDSDTLFLTVPDGSIQNIWDSMKMLPIKGKIICHCSGSLSSAIFSGIDQIGAFGYSIHPLFAISHKLESYKELSNALFTIEGHPLHLLEMKHLIEGCHNEAQLIDTDSKAKYHAAAVFVSNHVVALTKTGTDLLVQCGFSPEKAQSALAPLMLGNIKNILSQGPISALTGPVERNDMDTIKRHLSCLSGKEQTLYQLLSDILIRIAEEKHPEQNYDALKLFINHSNQSD